MQLDQVGRMVSIAAPVLTWLTLFDKVSGSDEEATKNRNLIKSTIRQGRARVILNLWDGLQRVNLDLYGETPPSFTTDFLADIELLQGAEHRLKRYARRLRNGRRTLVSLTVLTFLLVPLPWLLPISWSAPLTGKRLGVVSLLVFAFAGALALYMRAIKDSLAMMMDEPWYVKWMRD